MKNKNYWLNIILFILSTGCCLKDADNKKYLDKNKEIIWYHRESGAINEYETYFDYLMIRNYENMTIKQFCNIAEKYIDTVKSDKPVSSVTFIRTASFDCVPKYPDSYINSHEGYKDLLIDVGFENGLPQNANKKRPEIDGVTIYIGKDFKDYHSYTPNKRKSMDSLISIKDPLIFVLNKLQKAK